MCGGPFEGHFCIHQLCSPGMLCTKPIACISQGVLVEFPQIPETRGGGVLTAGAAFVPENVFWGGSKDKPHILQHPLWAEDTHCRVLGVGGGTACLIQPGRAFAECSESLKELF